MVKFIYKTLLLSLIFILNVAYGSPKIEKNMQGKLPSSAKNKINTSKSTAVFYGPNLPTDILSQYSRIIVESGNVKAEELTALKANNSSVFAYVSIGEVSPSRPWFKHIKDEWILGDNKVWDSKVMDLASPGWQDFILNSVVTPLWDKGYRGLFLDTMDSFYLFAKDPEEQKRQTIALTKLLQKIHQRYPDIRFISNRGFEVLSSIGNQLEAVVAESLYASWDNGKKLYKKTSANDQEWLRSKLNSIKKKASVDIIIIDYVELGKHKKAKEIAEKIMKEGFIPWISIPSLDLAGVGNIEPKMNTYLLLFDSKTETNNPLQLKRYQELVHKTKDKIIKIHDIRSGMPLGHMGGRYKSILSALPYKEQSKTYKDWIKKQIKEGVTLNMLTPKAAIPSKK